MIRYHNGMCFTGQVKVPSLTASLAVMFALLMLAISGKLFAVGFGKVTLYSYLNEPLSIEIELLGVDNIDPYQLQMDLASPKDFVRAGMARPFYLTKLNFDIIRHQTQTIAYVSTKSAITHPFLDFLVELTWPHGKLVKGYTLLIDPLPPAEQLLNRSLPLAKRIDLTNDNYFPHKVQEETVSASITKAAPKVTPKATPVEPAAELTTEPATIVAEQQASIATESPMPTIQATPTAIVQEQPSVEVAQPVTKQAAAKPVQKQSTTTDKKPTDNSSKIAVAADAVNTAIKLEPTAQVTKPQSTAETVPTTEATVPTTEPLAIEQTAAAATTSLTAEQIATASAVNQPVVPHVSATPTEVTQTPGYLKSHLNLIYTLLGLTVVVIFAFILLHANSAIGAFSTNSMNLLKKILPKFGVTTTVKPLIGAVTSSVGKLRQVKVGLPSSYGSGDYNSDELEFEVDQELAAVDEAELAKIAKEIEGIADVEGESITKVYQEKTLAEESKLAEIAKEIEVAEHSNSAADLTADELETTKQTDNLDAELLALELDLKALRENEQREATEPDVLEMADSSAASRGHNQEEIEDNDEIAIKFNLAKQYIDVGDLATARDILQEIINNANDYYVKQAKALIEQVTINV